MRDHAAMNYIGVIPKDLAAGAFWSQIAAQIAKAVPYGRGEYLLSDVREAIRAGQMFAIGIIEDGEVKFVATCSVVEYPQRRVLYVQYGAGIGAAQAKDALIDAARTLRCDWIETRTRASVAQLYRRAGFDVGYTVCILELENEP